MCHFIQNVWMSDAKKDGRGGAGKERGVKSYIHSLIDCLAPVKMLLRQTQTHTHQKHLLTLTPFCIICFIKNWLLHAFVLH